MGNDYLPETNIHRDRLKLFISTLKSVYASIVSLMFCRVGALCTEEIDQKSAQMEIANKLQEVGYPVSLIKRQLRKLLAPASRPSKEWIGTVVIPYKAGTSEVIRRLLSLAIQLRSVLAQVKGPLSVGRTRECAYKINCNDCAKICMGQTVRELHTRIGEHKRRINKPLGNVEEYQTLVKDSAMAAHAVDTGHRVDLKNLEFLRRGLRFTPQRLRAEAMEITKHHSVNRIEGVELASVWKAVRQLNVLHQAASCFSRYDIRDIAIHVYLCNALLIMLLKIHRQPTTGFVVTEKGGDLVQHIQLPGNITNETFSWVPGLLVNLSSPSAVQKILERAGSIQKA
ncbi:hypothetical protein T265_09656 [Opisthorchis viverrini]|uniref:C2H2-type domain-containing protein n=1 Tax=Opisthorchis viverrini TaxID=6198 RepID=A0A074ZG31_OPIVI|nr:hypothetical protein T265_09656 [Opisthorchis viverrini]KER22185.1 hypothetical protein T265_09656 [Opisthorchis viverrini]